MLTLPMLHNAPSSSVSPHKASVSSTDVQGTGQATDTAGFGELLAHEMSGKSDVSEPGLPNEKMVSGKVPSDIVITAGETETQTAGVQKDIKDGEPNTVAVTLVPQAMDMTAVLPGLAAAHLPGVRIDTQAHIQADVQNDKRSDGPDARLDSASQAELANAVAQNAVAQHAELVAPQFNPVVVRVAVAPTGGGGGASKEPATGAIDRSAPRNTKLSSDALANVAVEADPGGRVVTREKQASAMEPTVLDKISITKDDTPLSNPFQDGRQGALLHLESGLPNFSLTGEIRQSAKSKLEVAQHNLSAVQVDAGMATVIPERGSISAVSTVATGTPVHTALGLEPRLGTPGWDNALGQKVIWMVSQQQQVAELSLNPPDLGPLQVVLSISDDQVSATFISQQVDVRQALEAALPRLKEMMADSGINLSNTTVSADSPQQQKEPGQQNRSGAQYGKGDGHMTIPGIDMGTSHIHSAGNNLVDTFA